MRLVMLGAPGVGKGTQSKLLSQKYNIPQISTGDILRAAKDAGTELGETVKSILAAGDLVSDEIVNALVKEKITSDECKNGFILDGYPRTPNQAETLDNFLEELNQDTLKVINIDVPNEELIRRLVNRRKCNTCKTDFNLLQKDLPANGACPKCNSTDILHRADDFEETVRKRQATYVSQTQPLITHYKNKGVLYSFNGMKPISELFSEIEHLLHN
jgi:adenylate kinase